MPPFNSDAEHAYLGCLLLHNDAIELCRPAPEMFYFDENRIVAESILSMWDDGCRAIDYVTLGQNLEARGKLTDVGGIDHLIRLSDAVAHIAHVRYYATIVEEKYQRRQLIHQCQRIAAEARSPESNITEVIQHSTTVLQTSLLSTSSSNLPDFEFIDSAEFAERQYEQKWIVEYLLKPQQPCIFAGPSKSLKTTLLVELAVSLASGLPLLSKFPVTRQRVALVSAESGEETLQETASRICRKKGVEFASLSDDLHWAFRPPQIDEPSHIASLRRFIEHNRIDVLIIDPAYLCMGVGDEAKNQFVMGGVLQNLTALQSDTGVTPFLAAHTNKNIEPGVELGLSHIAYAGFGQWARQWILVNRRVAFDAAQPGSHKLFVSYGGSAGHSGAIAIDVEEGDIQGQRQWNYTLQSAADASRAAQEERTKQKEQKERDKRNAKYEERRSTILSVMREFPEGETESAIRKASRLSGTDFGPIFHELLKQQVIGISGEIKKGNGRNYDAYRIINPRDLPSGQNP